MNSSTTLDYYNQNAQSFALGTVSVDFHETQYRFRIASDYAGIPVKQMLFQELKETEKYDGIWACSSILHLLKQELKVVLMKMADALKEQGIIYTSFKYGNFEGERNGRYFTDFTEETFRDFIADITEIRIEEVWITGDVRQGRNEEKWLNLIMRKN